jgi:hypothetical protein
VIRRKCLPLHHGISVTEFPSRIFRDKTITNTTATMAKKRKVTLRNPFVYQGFVIQDNSCSYIVETDEPLLD